MAPGELALPSEDVGVGKILKVLFEVLGGQQQLLGGDSSLADLNGR